MFPEACERRRRADDALGAAAVGSGEDLLGRHVDDVPPPSTVSSSAVHQVAPGISPR